MKIVNLKKTLSNNRKEDHGNMYYAWFTLFYLVSLLTIHLTAFIINKWLKILI